MRVIITKHVDVFYYRYSWLTLIRPLTLTGSISPIIASSLFIYWKTNHIEIIPTTLLLMATLLIQMATNIWNDYFDFQVGQDGMKWLDHPLENSNHPMHHQLPYVASMLTIIAVIIGIFLAAMTTWWMILIGLSGIVAGFYYSFGNPSLSQIGLGEWIAAIYLGFATTMLPFLIARAYITSGIMLAIPFALLMISMILTNNIRDIEKDRSFRKTLATMLGRKKAVRLLQLLLGIHYMWLFFLIILQYLPIFSSLAIIGLPLAYEIVGSFKEDKTKPTGMKYAALHHWVFSISLTISLLVSL